MVPPDHVVGHNIGVAGVQEVLDGGLVALRRVSTKLLPARSETTTAHEVRDQLYIFARHRSASLPVAAT